MYPQWVVIFSKSVGVRVFLCVVYMCACACTHIWQEREAFEGQTERELKDVVLVS